MFGSYLKLGKGRNNPIELTKKVNGKNGRCWKRLKYRKNDYLSENYDKDINKDYT